MSVIVTRRAVDVSPASLLLSASDVGLATIMWVQPFVNPYPTGGDAYLWLGSTDHASAAAGKMFRGYSSAPDVAPSSWTIFEPPGADWSQPETPFFVHNPDHERPFFLYWHPSTSQSGGSQSSRLSTFAADWSNGTDEGEVLPATANLRPPALDHTGYMTVEREGPGVWHAWSLSRSATEITQAYWTSTDGIAWTCENDDVEDEVMMPPGRRLALLVDRFTCGGESLFIGNSRPVEHPGGAGAATLGRLHLVRVVDPTTFTAEQEVWRPSDDGVADDVRSVHILPDPEDPALVHVYVSIARVSAYHFTLSF